MYLYLLLGGLMLISVFVQNWQNEKEQTKKQEEYKELIESLQVGDIIVFKNGIAGTLLEIGTNTLLCDVAGTKITMMKTSILEIISSY